VRSFLHERWNMKKRVGMIKPRGMKASQPSTTDATTIWIGLGLG